MNALLAIDTSTPLGSVALLADARPLFSTAFQAGRGHGALLFPALEKALETLDGLPGGRLAEIVVGLGPGSYAGVRIAIAAATGLALARDARLTGISSLAALAPGDYIALGDARRESFYFAVVREGQGGECRVEGPELVAADALAARIARMEEGLPRLTSGLSPEMEAVGATLAFPDAVRLARLAAAGEAVIARERLEPIYLREPHITPPRPR